MVGVSPGPALDVENVQEGRVDARVGQVQLLRLAEVGDRAFPVDRGVVDDDVEGGQTSGAGSLTAGSDTFTDQSSQSDLTSLSSPYLTRYNE